MYELKKGEESFTLVDGPDAGKTFHQGKKYQKIPAGYEFRFFSDKKSSSTPDDNRVPGGSTKSRSKNKNNSTTGKNSNGGK